MSTSITGSLTDFVQSLRLENLPGPIVERAKTCILDAVACSCGGHDLPWTKAAAKLAGDHAGRTDATIWIGGGKSNIGYTALANAVASHSIIQEDMHAETAAHLGSVVIPAAMALGEKLHVGGAEVLTAIVAGYETMARIGKVVASPEFSSRGFRPSGSFGPFGSATAAALLWGLTRDEMLNALGLAGNLASGVNEWAHAGTADIFFHNGFASHNGLMAADLARNGVTAPERIVEGRAGLANAWAGNTGDPAWAMADLGEVFEIERVYHKPAPACAFTQETTQAALKLVGENRIDPADIAEITVAAYPMVKLYTGCDFAGPFTSLVQAQMSNQFAVASVIVRGDVDFKYYVDFANPTVYDIARKIKVEIDPEAAAVFPKRKQSRITLTTTSGKVIVAEQKDLQSLTREGILRKLASLGGDWFTDDALGAITAKLAAFETLGDVGEFVALLKADKAR